MNSLNGNNYQIKCRALITESIRTGIDPDIICKTHTGLEIDEYLERPFNRQAYYEYTRQRNWQTPTINFWRL